MFLIYTQQVVQADATGLFILALIISIFVIPPIVKKSKISEAKDLKNRFPQGYNKVCSSIYYIDYQNAKKVIACSDEIIAAQRQYDEEQRKMAEARKHKDRIYELRRLYPYATIGKSDDYVSSNEYAIQQTERKHAEREAKAKEILQKYPLGVKAVLGYISTIGSISDENIEQLINTESIIKNSQKICEENEAELKKVSPQLEELKRKYPIGVTRICTIKKWSISNADHVKLLLLIPGEIAEQQEQGERIFLNNKDRVAAEVKRAKDIISRFNKPYAKNTIARQYGEKIAKRIMEIIKVDEDFQAISKHLDSIGKSQNAFAQETRNVIAEVLNGWGWYNYNFSMVYTDENLNTRNYSLKVWQAFCVSCCFDDSVSYDYYPTLKKNRIYKQQLESTSNFNSDSWDKVMNFIKQMKNKYGNDLFVVLANTDHLNENAFENNFKYFKEQLKNAGISFSESVLAEKHDSQNRKYVVVDIITENSELTKYCSSLFHYRHIMRMNENQGTTGVVFITMLKCYDGAEVEELNKSRIKERENELRKAKEEEEKKQKEQRDLTEAKSIASSYPIGFKRYFPNISTSTLDASLANMVVLKKAAIRDYEETLARLQNNVSGWDTVRGVPHYFFYYYYPTRFTDVSSDSQDARRLVYNFKDGLAHNKVKELVVGKIRGTFSTSDLPKMCFVCIPASTRSVHQSRYEAFSNEVSQELGISNAYNYITITKEKMPAHLGGEDRAEYSYDKAFFNGKFVILFDDIVTRGGSVSSMKSALESLGAKVICAISIGRTFSDWNGNTPKPHPYTGRL